MDINPLVSQSVLTITICLDSTTSLINLLQHQVSTFSTSLMSSVLATQVKDVRGRRMNWLYFPSMTSNRMYFCTSPRKRIYTFILFVSVSRLVVAVCVLLCCSDNDVCTLVGIIDENEPPIDPLTLQKINHYIFWRAKEMRLDYFFIFLFIEWAQLSRCHVSLSYK